MNAVNLKDNIWIEGFDSDITSPFPKGYCPDNSIYFGKTSEIPEEIAKKCAELLTPKHPVSLWRNYEYNKPQPVSFTKCTAKESIQSACDKEYCIIYKTK